MISSFSKAVLRIFGWHVSHNSIPLKKFVIIGAPHTSNWDFPLSLLALSAMGIKFSWIGKHSLFKPPFGTFFRFLGGIPVNRNVRLSFIDNMTQLFNDSESLKLAIAPEGTRSKKNHWKTGFYYIAVAAKVPVVLAYIDYTKKELGLGPILSPTGNLENDFELIRTFYKNKIGKYPENQSSICLRKREAKRAKNQL